MCSLKINSNIASLNAQRRLAQSSKSLSESFARLSSGLRINRASDDAAGLAIANGLLLDARVYSQGIRNVNDAVSLLNTAEGAATELNSLLIRNRELASQAANGTLSFTQRKALHEEANALVEEYNRIVSSTSFNNRELIDGTFGTLAVQAGYGANGSISFAVGEELSTEAGTGTIASEQQVATLNGAFALFAGDIDGDGDTDLLGGAYYDSGVNVFLNDGGGNFTKSSLATGLSDVRSFASADFNNDALVDIVAGGGDSKVSVLLANGDGTYSTHSFVGFGGTTNLYTADFNGDGLEDVFFSGSHAYVSLGNGDGTFSAKQTVDTSVGARGVSDFDRDGTIDILTSAGIQFGNGDGTFNAPQSLPGAGAGGLVADFNNDGYDDLYGSGNTYLNDGDGTFTLADSGILTGSRAVDVTGDGILDLIGVNSGNIVISEGVGDGTFRPETTFATTNPDPVALVAADFTGNGAAELIAGENSINFGTEVTLYTQETVTTSTIGQIRLYTQEDALAAIDVIDSQLETLAAELGVLGANRSRLNSTLSVLASVRENYTAAASQIRDVDVAEEAAKLVRHQILQQAGVAVLAQANATPELALLLLS